MKYLKLFESYTESDIAKICKKYGIRNWSLDSEGLVDVDGDVILRKKGLTKVPLSFGRVSGDFLCSGNELTSLQGAPKSVGLDFWCHYNKLTNLEGSPQIVGGNFWCLSNKLTSLRFAPEEVEGEAVVLPNPITDIPKKYLSNEYLQFIVKEQPDWRLYSKDGSMRLDRLEEMIEWGIESNKIKPI